MNCYNAAYKAEDNLHQLHDKRSRLPSKEILINQNLRTQYSQFSFRVKGERSLKGAAQKKEG